MTLNEQGQKADSEQLSSEIEKWKVALTAIGAALIGGYFVYFAWLVNLPASENADKWGAFGDFFGGLMNPVVAFAAFYWLTRSVKLQKEELAKTELALREAATAQKELAANGLVQVQLAALTALANSASDEMSVAATDKASYLASRPSSGTQAVMYEMMNGSAYSDAKVMLHRAKAKRDKYLAQMEAILEAHSPSAPLDDEPPGVTEAESVKETAKLDQSSIND